MKRLALILVIICGFFMSCSVNEADMKIENNVIIPNVKYAGVRSSSYGIKPFPSPEQWETYIKNMSGYFRNSSPCAIWIVGILDEKVNCFLNFPAEKGKYNNINFNNEDTTVLIKF